MNEKKFAPYGSWKSPITSELIVTATVGLSQIMLDGEDVYWMELRPNEGGRNCIVRRATDGEVSDVTPKDYNARTRVHEYGGGDFAVREGVLIFSNFKDQRLYLQERGGETRPVTPDAELRYADFVIDSRKRFAYCVREDHRESGREAVNSIVRINLEGDEEGGRVLVSGHDFYSSPRISPDGTRLAWLAWNHPNMPWDETELWIADLTDEGEVSNARAVAGGSQVSIYQPEWSPDGLLHFVSDRSGWWNIHRLNEEGESENLCEMDAEFGEPLWIFGKSSYGFVTEERLVCTYIERGVYRLATLDAKTKKLNPIDTPYTDVTFLRASGDRVFFRAVSPTERASIVEMNLETNKVETLQRASETRIDPGYISTPLAVEYPTEGGRTAHGFFYAPLNKDFEGPEGELPPLVVKCHGGPTSMTTTALRLEIQYWTSRGIAVLDVNYGGSSGYGRAYRDSLKDVWGEVDVDDSCNGARYLIERGEVDADRCAITGGSAGGFTVLNALTFRNTFRAGASHYGVSDLKGLIDDTHKFESRYLDGLVGPYPERADLYHDRSSINFTERLSCPVIFFQGLEDKVVPPDQAEKMVEALRRKGLPVAYVPFEGEQHGFRRAENIKRALDGELYFYSRIFGFETADELEPVPIENL